MLRLHTYAYATHLILYIHLAFTLFRLFEVFFFFLEASRLSLVFSGHLTMVKIYDELLSRFFIGNNSPFCSSSAKHN